MSAATLAPANRRLRWTSAEVDFLRTWYARRYSHWCAEKLGRSVRAVYAKAHTLGLRITRKRSET